MQAIQLARAWARGEITMTQAHSDANAAARDVDGAAMEAAHAAAVAHELGAATYAIIAVRAAAPKEKRDEAGRLECQWQRARLPQRIRDLVLHDRDCAMSYAGSYSINCL